MIFSLYSTLDGVNIRRTLRRPKISAAGPQMQEDRPMKTKYMAPLMLTIVAVVLYSWTISGIAAKILVVDIVASTPQKANRAVMPRFSALVNLEYTGTCARFDSVSRTLARCLSISNRSLRAGVDCSTTKTVLVVDILAIRAIRSLNTGDPTTACDRDGNLKYSGGKLVTQLAAISEKV